MARAYRGWALDRPNAYRPTHHTGTGSGLDLAPERTRAVAQRGMDVFLRVLAPLHARAAVPLESGLAAEVTRWGDRTEVSGLPVETLSLGLTCWTRLHGVVSLEPWRPPGRHGGRRRAAVRGRDQRPAGARPPVSPDLMDV